MCSRQARGGSHCLLLPKPPKPIIAAISGSISSSSSDSLSERPPPPPPAQRGHAFRRAGRASAAGHVLCACTHDPAPATCTQPAARRFQGWVCVGPLTALPLALPPPLLPLRRRLGLVLKACRGGAAVQGMSERVSVRIGRRGTSNALCRLVQAGTQASASPLHRLPPPRTHHRAPGPPRTRRRRPRAASWPPPAARAPAPRCSSPRACSCPARGCATCLQVVGGSRSGRGGERRETRAVGAGGAQTEVTAGGGAGQQPPQQASDQAYNQGSPPLMWSRYDWLSRRMQSHTEQ